MLYGCKCVTGDTIYPAISCVAGVTVKMEMMLSCQKKRCKHLQHCSLLAEVTLASMYYGLPPMRFSFFLLISGSIFILFCVMKKSSFCQNANCYVSHIL